MLKSKIEELQLHKLTNDDLMGIINCKDQDLDVALAHIRKKNDLKLTESELLKNLNRATCEEHGLSPKKHKSFSAGLGFATLPIDAVAFTIGSVAFFEAIAIAIAGLLLSVLTFALTFLLTQFYIKKKKDLFVNFFILNEMKRAAAELLEQRIHQEFPNIKPIIPTLERDRPKTLDLIDKVLEKINRPMLISASIALPLAGALFFSYFASSSSSIALLGLSAAAIAAPGVNLVFFCVVAVCIVIAAYLAFRCYKEEKPWKAFKQTVAKERTEVEQLTKKATALYTLADAAEQGVVKPTAAPELATSPKSPQPSASNLAVLESTISPKSPQPKALEVKKFTTTSEPATSPRDFPHTLGLGTNPNILMAAPARTEPSAEGSLYAPLPDEEDAEQKQSLLS